MSDTPEFLMIVTAKGAKKLADKFGSTASAATFTCAEHGEKCVTVAECAENQGYVWSYDDETHGNFAIKVDGEEIDHADTRAEAKRHRNAIIYGEIGTEQNTTIEPKHKLIETPDDKYPHLAYAACTCGKWETAGASPQITRKVQFDRHLALHNAG